MGDAKGKRALAVLLGIVLVASQSSVLAFAEEDGGSAPEKTPGLVEDAGPVDAEKLLGAMAVGVPYFDANGVEQICPDAIEVDGSASWGNAGVDTWYVVPAGEVTAAQRIRVSGDVHLILADGAKLVAEKGIGVHVGNSLTIYRQVNGTGVLMADGGNRDAGIGGDVDCDAGKVTVNGGSVTAKSAYGAGIGGGYVSIADGAGGHGAGIVINGGSVTAESTYGAGIGGGSGSIAGGAGGIGGDVTVNGGSVTAESTYGAGIGGGYGSITGGAGGDVTVNVGSVTAKSNHGAGIGGGYGVTYGGDGGAVSVDGGSVRVTSTDGAGIGGGSGTGGIGGSGGTVAVNGGSVDAKSDWGAGIGGGFGRDRDNDNGIMYVRPGRSGTFSTSEPGNAFIVASGVREGYHIQDASKENEWSGVIFLGVSGAVYGSPTLMQDAEIPEGCTLVVGSGETLTVGKGTTLAIGGTVENHGTINNYGSIARSVGSASGSINNDGVVNDHGSIEDGLVEGNDINVPSQVRLSFSVAGSSDSVTSASFGQTVIAAASVSQKTRSTSPGTVNFYLNEKTPGNLLGSADMAGGSASLGIPLTAAKGFIVGANRIIADFGGSPGLIPSEAEVQLFVGLGSQPIERIEMNKTELVYGDAAPLVTPALLHDGAAVSYSIVADDTGADAESDVASIDAGGAITVSKAGSFCVKAEIAATDEYAEKILYSALITVEKRKVSVRPADVSIVQGEALPAFSLAYDGLAAGESIAPTEEPAFSCEADGSKPGEFAIAWTNMDAVQFTNAENYEVSKQAQGTLRVAEPASREIFALGGANGWLASAGDDADAAPLALLALASASALAALGARRRHRTER